MEKDETDAARWDFNGHNFMYPVIIALQQQSGQRGTQRETIP